MSASSLRLAFLCILLASAGCKPSLGETCGEAAQACSDDHTMLVCKAGHYAAIRCDGEAGCVYDDKTRRASCDFSGAKIGSFCDSTFAGERMCKSATQMIACRDNKFDVLKCRGPDGCTPSKEERTKKKDPFARVKLCDDSVARVGDDCDPIWSMNAVCDANGVDELACDKKKSVLVFRRKCRGKGGCASKDGVATCDASVRSVGDSCDGDGDRWEGCGPENGTMRYCANGRVYAHACLGVAGCAVTAKGVVCDDGRRAVGQDCTTEGELGCDPSADVRNGSGVTSAIVVCEKGRFAVKRACKRACVVRVQAEFLCAEDE